MTAAARRGILVVDNHDSFVFTLVGYLRQLGAEPLVVEADAVTLSQAEELMRASAGVMLSPGPGAPRDAGVTIPAARLAAHHRVPVLGVCLGHQAITEAFGGRVGAAPELMHGMSSSVRHDGSALFEGIPTPFAAGRYHSLAVQSLPEALRATAWSDSGTVMGIAHRELPIYGVQFHPESVLTEHGYRLLANWLELCAVPGAVAASADLVP